MVSGGARNRFCFLVDAVGWPLGQSFLSASTILPMFVARLAGNNLLVGMVAGIQSAGQFLPQLVASHWIERLRVTRRYVAAVGIVVERLPLVVLVAAILLGAEPATLLTLFACWAVVNLGTGINMPAFLTLFAKSVPASERAGLVGAGNAAGTLLASAGALVAMRLLQSGSGLLGYAWCFLIGIVVLIATVIPLAFVREPLRREVGTRSLSGHLREIPGLLRSDRRFGVYVAMQAALQLAPAAVGFVTGYAVLELRASEGLVALGSALMLGAEALGSVVLGAAANRRGCRPVFVVAAASGTLLYGILAFAADGRRARRLHAGRAAPQRHRRGLHDDPRLCAAPPDRDL